MVPSDTVDAGEGTDTLFANADEDFDFTNAQLSSFETLRFYQGSADQNIAILSDNANEIQTYTGNASQTNTLQVESTTSANNIDLSQKTFNSRVEKTIINSNFAIASELIGNDQTQDTINRLRCQMIRSRDLMVMIF